MTFSGRSCSCGCPPPPHSTTLPPYLLHMQLRRKQPAARAAGVVVRSAASSNISRTLVSTCSGGSSVRIFIFLQNASHPNEAAQNLRVPYVSAVTYTRAPRAVCFGSLFPAILHANYI